MIPIFKNLLLTIKEWFPDRMSYLYFIFALIISSIYWIAIVTEEKETKSLPVDVKFVDVKEGYSVVGPDSHTKVSVEISATNEVLKRITSDDIKVTVSARDFKEGPLIYQLSKEDVTLPSSVTFVNIFPKILQLELDKNIVKEVPLKPQFTGRLKDGKSIISYEIMPSTVEVYGPQSILKSLRFVPTQPIPLSEKSGNFTLQVVPIVDDPEIKVVKSDKIYTLKVITGEKKSQKIVDKVKVNFKKDGKDVVVSAEPEEIYVVVEGDENIIQNVKPEDISAVVDLSGLAPKEYSIKPLVEKKKDSSKEFNIVSFAPVYIKVKISDKGE